MAWWIFPTCYPDKDTAERLYRIEQGIGELQQDMETVMSALSDIQAKQAITDANVAKVKADVEALLAKIAAIPPGGLTPEQQAAIDDIANHADAINTALGAVDALTPDTPPTT